MRATLRRLECYIFRALTRSDVAAQSVPDVTAEPLVSGLQRKRDDCGVRV